MHQTYSYKEQFTPWLPNTCVIDNTIEADNIMIALEYYTAQGDFPRHEYVNDLLFGSLYSNGICRILISKSQKAYKDEH